MNIWKSILLAGCIALVGGALELYLVTLADRWAVQKVGEIGSMSGALLLFLPKLIYGFLIGVVTELIARRTSTRYFRTGVLLGFIAYFVWKFQVTEVWIASEIFAYALALGPYLIFFLSFGVAAFLMRRKGHKAGS